MNFSREPLSKNLDVIYQIFGAISIIGLWQIIIQFKLFPTSIIPSPLQILYSLKELHFEDALIINMFYTIKLNILGNLECILFAIPIGFLIALNKPLRSILNRYVTSFRFIPMPILIGVFIVLFGIYDMMKIQFLAVSTFVYLLPSVIERVDELNEVYLQTAYTIGANKAQTIFTIFLPGTLPAIFNDIKNLAALSWTYIVIAEMINASSGGIGALCFTAARYSRIDKVFVILFIIVLIGWTQDKILSYLGTILFPYYQ